MKAARSHGSCSADFSCMKLDTVSTPQPRSGEALIQVNGSSVNPSDVDEAEYGACVRGCGADVSGTVVSCNGCSRIKVGDEVWTLASPAYAEYVVASEADVGLKPAGLPFREAATIPGSFGMPLLGLRLFGLLGSSRGDQL
jgi:NADPH:quinone reductase-like Zn-dependent oxidoreductase